MLWKLFFWPDTSRVIYFEYELSPLNYELPLIIFNDKGNTSGWLPFYYRGQRKTNHAVEINTNKTSAGRFTWTAEFFIPYALITSLKNVSAAERNTVARKFLSYRL
jgi:hypothetical protein